MQQLVGTRHKIDGVGHRVHPAVFHQPHMLLPGVGIHASQRAVVECAYLGLGAIASDIEALEVDEQFLPHWQIGTQVGGIDAHDNAARGILHGQLLVDVAAQVIATHHHLQLQVVGYLHTLAALDGGCIFLFQRVHRGHAAVGILLYVIVSVGRILCNRRRRVPVAVHAGGQGHAAHCHQQRCPLDV